MSIKKFISLILLNCLLISFVCKDINYAFYVPLKPIYKDNKMNDKFFLPLSYGKITKAHFTNSDRLIINIQDLHCHPQVQKNISNIIDLFNKKIPVNNIYLEGAYGDIDISWLIKIKNLLGIDTVNKILDTGRITGVEYYCALIEKNDIIKGLENKDEYIDNIKRLSRILNNQKQTSVILKSISQTTNNLKQIYYNERQIKVDKLSNEYNDGTITAEKYFSLLTRYTGKLNIDINKYKNISGYIKLLLIQKKLDYPKITNQLKNLLIQFKKILPADMYLFLSKTSDNFSKIDKIYEYLYSIIDEYKIDLSKDFKDLDGYFNYVKLSGLVNPLEIVEENRLLINEINLRLLNTKAQREILFLVDFEKYLTDFLNAKITEQNYEYFKNNIEKYKNLWDKYADNDVLNLLKEYIAQNSIFYDINKKRNDYFAKNIFEGVKYNSSNIIKTSNDLNDILNNLKHIKRVDIVVTGGFHTESISNLLEENNITYIVVTPKVREGTVFAENTYHKLIKEQSIIQTQTIAAILNSLAEGDISLKIKILIAAGISNDNIKLILPQITDAEINNLRNTDENVEQFVDNSKFEKIVKISEILADVSSENIVESLRDFLFFYINDEGIRNEVDSDLILNYLDLDKLKQDVTLAENLVIKAIEKRHFLNDDYKTKLYKVFIKLFNKLPIKFLSNMITDKLNEYIYINEMKQIFNNNYNHLGKIHAIVPLAGGFQEKFPVKVVTVKDGVKTYFVLKPIARRYIDLKRNPDVIADGINFAEKENLPTSKVYKTKDGKNFVENGNYFYMLNDFAHGKTVTGTEFNNEYIINTADSLAASHNKFRNNKNEFENKVKDWNIDTDINPELFNFSNELTDKKLEELGILNLTQELNLNYDEKKYVLYLHLLWKDENVLRVFLTNEDEITVKFIIDQAKKLRQIWNDSDKSKLEQLYIHGDWNIENIFFDDNNNVSSLIDWEQYSKAYRIIDFYRFFVDTRNVNLFEIDTFLNFLFEYQNKSDNPLNEEELNALLALMRFGFISRAKYVLSQDNKNEFFYNIKKFDEFFADKENNITKILKLEKKELQKIINSVIKYPNKDMKIINRMKKSIKNNEPISISFVCLLNKHRSASAHIMFEYYLKKSGKDKIQINSFGIIPLVSLAGKFFKFVENNKLFSKLFGIDYHDDMETEIETFIKENDNTFNKQIFDYVKNKFKSENVTREYTNADYIVVTSKIQKMLLQILLGKSANIILFSDISIVMPDDTNLADPGRTHISVNKMLQLLHSSIAYLTSGQKDTGYKGYEEVTNSTYEKSVDNLIEKIIFCIFFAITKVRNIISKLQNISIFTLNSKTDIIEPADLFLTEDYMLAEILRNKNYNIAFVDFINGQNPQNVYPDWKKYKKTDINIKHKGEKIKIYVKFDNNNNIDSIIFYSKNRISSFDNNVDFEQLKKKLQEQNQDGFVSTYLKNVNCFIPVVGENEQEMEKNIINRTKVNVTHNAYMQAIEGVLNISNKQNSINSVITDAISNDIGVIVVNQQQMRDNLTKIINAQKKYGLKFVLSTNAYDNLLDGNRIDATSLNYEQVKNLLEEISLSDSLKVSTRLSVKIDDEVLKQFDEDIFQKYGIIPIININNKNIYSGKFELELTKEDENDIDENKVNIDKLLKEPNLISISVDDVALLYANNGNEVIKDKLKEVNNSKKYYNIGLKSVLDSKFIDDFIVNKNINIEFFNNNEFLKDMLTKDFTNNTYSSEELESLISVLKNSTFFYYLPEVARIYLEDIINEGNYTQVIGAVRGILINTVEKQTLKQLNKNNKLNISVNDFRKKLNFDYRIAYLTLTMQLILESKQKTDLDFVETSVSDVEKNTDNIIRKIVRENDYKIEPLTDDLLANYAIIEDIIVNKLRDFEINPEIQSSIQNLKKVFAAA